MKKLTVLLITILVFPLFLYAQDIKTLREISDPAIRNSAIFQWIEENPDKMFEPVSAGEENSKNCSKPAVELFQLIIDSLIPEDCWKALLLFRERFPETSTYPDFDKPMFASPKARNMLLETALDISKSLEERKVALICLDQEETVWPVIEEGQPSHLKGLDKAEQARFIDSLLLLLDSDIPVIRQYAVDAVFRASSTLNGAPAELITDRALPQLSALYGTEIEGDVLNSLAEAIIEIGGIDHWESLTGNPLGVVITVEPSLWDKKLEDGLTLYIWFKYGPSGCYEGSKMSLEKIDVHGNVIEKQSQDFLFKLSHGDSTSSGSQALGCGHSFGISYSNLSEGTWRITIKGTLDTWENFFKWTSVPYSFVVPEKDKNISENNVIHEDTNEQYMEKTENLKNPENKTPVRIDYEKVHQEKYVENNKREISDFELPYRILSVIFLIITLLFVFQIIFRKLK